VERPTRLDLARVGAYATVVFTGAIFGIFYAWVCSTMWGLDETDPRVAIAAMQAMNASVRNAFFFPAFFVTPIVAAVTGVAMRVSGRRPASWWFFATACVYLIGGLVLTMAINVPMNRELADLAIPSTVDEARRIWGDYSGPWQSWNTIRTIASGVALVLAAIGLRASSAGSG